MRDQREAFSDAPRTHLDEFLVGHQIPCPNAKCGHRSFTLPADDRLRAPP
jgi:hypothetical protein